MVSEFFPDEAGALPKGAERVNFTANDWLPDARQMNRIAISLD
jgi:hypothetical protein